MKRVKEEYFSNKREIEDLRCYATCAKVIKVDGVLKKEEWNNTQSIRLFPYRTSKNKSEFIKVSTDVMIKWDDKNIYFAFECEEPKMDKIYVTDAKRDSKLLWQESGVEIFLNPTADRKKYYQIMINANGDVADLKAERKGKSIFRDWKWDGDVEAKIRKTTIGWTLECKISVKSIGLENIEERSSWVVNFCRRRKLVKAFSEQDELQTWSTFLKMGFHDIDRFGKIKFVKKVPASENLVLNPSFENIQKDKTNPWKIKKNQHRYISFTDETFRDGCTSLKITVPENDVNLFAGITQYLPQLKPDTEYLLNYYAKANNIKRSPKKVHFSNAYIKLWLDYGYNNFYPQNCMSGTFDWTKFGIKFKTPKTTNTSASYKGTKAYMGIRMVNATGTLWMDDIRIRPCSVD
jgi:hypothetical protein